MAKIEKSKKRKQSKEAALKRMRTKPKKVDTESDDSSLPSTDSDRDNDSEDIRKLLEPFSKEQLIDFVSEAAVKNSPLYKRILEVADTDISHRKIFVHGLGWDTSRETLTQYFQSYGDIEDINLVTDRNTGKAKGFAFISFKTRKATEKALKEPRKKISNRFASCQLASQGPVPAQQNQDTFGRKIYISNVQPDVDAEKLRSFFAKFGEIETGPIGFDMQTGKSRGFALFLYKTEEGAKKALAEPVKVFDGTQLNCQKAADGKNKAPSGAAAAMPHVPALAAAQNMIVNPMYNNRMIATPNFFGGAMNPMLAAGMIPGSQLGLSAYGMISPSMLGSYGANAAALGMQQVYPNTQMGQASQIGPTNSAQSNVTGGGSFSGYPSQSWYDLSNPIYLCHHTFFPVPECACLFLCLFQFMFPT